MPGPATNPTGPRTPPPPSRPQGPPPPGKPSPQHREITFRVGRGVPVRKPRRPFGVRLAIYTIEFGALITGAMSILAILPV